MSQKNSCCEYAGVSLTFSAGGQLVFNWWAKHFKRNLFINKPFLRFSNQAGEAFLLGGQFAQCSALIMKPQSFLFEVFIVNMTAKGYWWY